MPEMLARVELLAETLGHGAEVLADDHALAALALQRDLADQIVDGIGEIGALGGPGAGGDHEEARQAHRVIDPQQAGVAHVGAVERGEAAPAVARAGDRIGRRQVPDLALRGERIGRRADADLGGEFARARPALRAVGRRADREVAIEPDFEAARAARVRRRAASCRSARNCAEQGEADVLGELARLGGERRRLAARRASGQWRQSSPWRSPRDRLEERRIAAAPRRPRSRKRVVVGEDGPRPGAPRGRARRRRSARAARRA